MRAGRSAPRRAVPDLHRQGQQAAARADRRGGGRLGASATQREARPALLEEARRRRGCSSTRAAAARLSRVGFWKILKGYGAAGEPAADAQPARAAPLVRDAPARARRRPARDPDDARPRRSVDDADLHARARGAAADRLRPLPPARLILLDLTVSQHVIRYDASGLASSQKEIAA